MEIVHFDQRQLAACWTISEATLERWRSEGIAPEFLKLCGRVLPMNDVGDSVAGRAGHRSFTRGQSDAHRRPADPQLLPIGTTLAAHPVHRHRAVGRQCGKRRLPTTCTEARAVRQRDGSRRLPLRLLEQRKHVHPQQFFRRLCADQALDWRQLSEQLFEQRRLLRRRDQRLPCICQQQWLLPERLWQFAAVVCVQLSDGPGKALIFDPAPCIERKK